MDVVFHLASPASPVDYLRLPLATLKVGSYGTHNALGLAKFKRARFLIASTSEVYGDPEVHPQREEYWGNVNPVGPRGVYDEAKRYSEAMTMAYHRQQGVDTHIARIFNTYGPRMRQHDGRAIPTFLRQALEGKPITVFGDGSQTRSFCYVDDLIEGLFRLAMSDYHLPVNVGNPDEMTLLELAEKIVQLTGVALGDRVRGPAGRRPQGAPARHHPGPRGAGLGAEGVARRGPAAHDREPRPHARPRLTGAWTSTASCANCRGCSPTSPAPRRRSTGRLQPLCEGVEGLSEENNLALLALAAGCLDGGECYVEAGSYRGRSLIAAALGGAEAAIGIDNFSFDDSDPAGLVANVERFGVGDRVRVIHGDTVAVLREQRPAADRRLLLRRRSLDRGDAGGARRRPAAPGRVGADRRRRRRVAEGAGRHRRVRGGQPRRLPAAADRRPRRRAAVVVGRHGPRRLDACITGAWHRLSSQRADGLDVAVRAARAARRPSRSAARRAAGG